MWDEASDKWINLDSTVDPVTHTITAPVSHFTDFTVLAYTRPATFTTSRLTITPAEVDIGGRVTISVLVANTGDLTGSYEVTVKIDDVLLATKEVTVAGGDSETVIFNTTKDVAGTYAVDVDGLSGTFTVKVPVAPPPPTKPAVFTVSELTITPAEVDIGEEVTISVLVSNTGDLSGSYELTLKLDNVIIATKPVALAGGASQKITFTTTKDVAGTYNVKVDGLSGTLVVKAPPVPPKPEINWWLIGGIIVAVIVVGGLLVYFLWWRRRI